MDIPFLLTAADAGYGEPVMTVHSDGKEIFVISDLHLASGINQSRNYDGTENFFTDDSFVRYLDHLQKGVSGKPAILLINGDFIDFLRIRDLPVTAQDFLCWQAILGSIGIQKTIEDLQASIVNKEREYGLKTHDYKSVWKLHVCVLGHNRFFERLARWLHDGNELIITKGNHDLEWYWPAVRHYFRLYMARTVSLQRNTKANHTLAGSGSRQIRFADHAVLIDGSIYAEHGHRFDSTTAVQGEPLLANRVELNIPFGSFFNRYLINRLELSYPYLDNVRPTSNILLVLIRERFPLAIKMLFRYVPFMLLIIPKKLYWQTFKYLLSFLLVIVLPLVVTGFAIWHSWPHTPVRRNPSFIIQQLLSQLRNFGFLFLSYIFGRILVFVRIKPPYSFYGDAQDIFAATPALRIVTFGHTHNPEQRTRQETYYYNTGTWIPVYESAAADVRFDKTFTYLHITRDERGIPVASPLLRWNDDALRSELMVLTDKK